MEKWKGYLGFSKIYGIFASVFILNNLSSTGHGNGLASVGLLPIISLVMLFYWAFIGWLGTLMTKTVVKVNILILLYNWIFWTLSYIAVNISDLRYNLFSTFLHGFSDSISIAIICSAFSIITSLITKFILEKKEKADDKQESLPDLTNQ